MNCSNWGNNKKEYVSVLCMPTVGGHSALWGVGGRIILLVFGSPPLPTSYDGGPSILNSENARPYCLPGLLTWVLDVAFWFVFWYRISV